MDGLDAGAFENGDEAELNQYNQLVAQDNEIAQSVVANMRAADATIAERASEHAQAQAMQAQIAERAVASANAVVSGEDDQFSDRLPVSNLADRRKKKKRREEEKAIFSPSDEDKRAA